MSVRPVHPFPARMAPDIAERAVSELPPRSLVLDPMMGSGTFLAAALQFGHDAMGFDTDPLAVLIARTALEQFDMNKLSIASEDVVAFARDRQPYLPADAETREFIDYWFDESAARALGQLASAIGEQDTELQAPLWCAFSRLIITKDAGASRARDVSHSRPHRVRDGAAFDPIDRYLTAVRTVTSRMLERPPTRGGLRLAGADARRLPIGDKSVDALTTSPPYLAAIDYLRGHRLSLVWMGHTIADLRELRGTNIGSERQSVNRAREQIDPQLSSRANGILRRYEADLRLLATEAVRVVKPGGAITWVVGKATMEGKTIPIHDFASRALTVAGARPASRRTRLIPADRRYLPPPQHGVSALTRRIRGETVLTFTA